MLTRTKIAGLTMALMALSAPLVWADDASTASATAGLAPASSEGTSHQDGDWHHEKREHMMFKILNLSEDQEKQFRDIKQKQKDAKKIVFEQIKSNRDAFEAEIAKAAPDMSKITDLQTQFKAIQSQMADEHLNSLLEIKKILTPEQFAGYMALEREEDMMKHMMGHNSHMDGMGKDWDGHKHWNDRSDKDQGSDD